MPITSNDQETRKAVLTSNGDSSAAVKVENQNGPSSGTIVAPDFFNLSPIRKILFQKVWKDNEDEVEAAC